VDFDLVAFFELQCLDDGTGKTNGKAVSPFRNPHDPRSLIAICSRTKHSQGGSVRPLRGAFSVDDLVGAGEDRWRYGQTERLGGLEVDHQLEGGRLLHRQIGRLLTLEDPSDINADLSPCASEIRPIANQTAGCSVSRKS